MAAARRMRGFKRWMKREEVECSDALHISLSVESGGAPSISVKASCDLMEGDVVATIPKRSCLTVRTSAASRIIEEAQLGGYLGLSVALMYERSLGPQSKWFQYLQILPSREPIPLLWSLAEIDSLLCGTEIHKIVKEDKALVYQDWKECIKPLLGSASLKLNPDFFSVDEYLAAKSLIASRSFQIDEYHGYGMVPLADLFNHKTAAEDVHFTSVSYYSESDIDSDNQKRDSDGENNGDDEPMVQDFHSEMGGFRSELEFESSSTSGNDVMVMQMIICKDVNSGSEVFNTYGSLSNAALLHRYGFTEPENPFDILNMDLEIVLQWSSSVFSCRHSRRRLSLWRKLGYSGCDSQNSQYFEISFHGEPQAELLVLLNIILLPEEVYHELELALLAVGNSKQITSRLVLEKYNFLIVKAAKLSKELLLTRNVCQALLSLADAREQFYGSNSLQDDIKSFDERCQATEHKLYHSLRLRICERRILKKLRSYAASGLK
ncbi:ribosomal lysine N-methyltransferase 3 isoform X2 [Primulina eburnea]|uniref:ribosomal lysine N-methyltransferase 3 isoform X2 n=1 Tax=Primulina eburnea TaxID=1245227 RepID=UPI003C6C2F2D